MHDSLGQYDDLLKVAGDYARDADRLRLDVAAMIFPRASNPPSEALLADITQKFSRLIEDIERNIAPGGGKSSFGLTALLQSGFHRDKALLEFLLARHAEQQLEMRLAARSNFPLSHTLPSRLLVDGDHNVAEAAQTILATSSLNRRAAPLEWGVLPPELLHGICWRIVSAQKTEDAGVARQKMLQLLANYDESRIASSAAQKLLHLLGGKHHVALESAEEAGLTLFVSNLARKTLLRYDQLIRLIDLPSISPFAVLQRAAGLNSETAMKNVRAFFGFDRLTPNDIMLFEQGFDQLPSADAKAAVLGWQCENTAAGGDVV